MRGFQPAHDATATGEKPKFSKGGPVRGPGTGTSDEVRDVVPEGTYVMPADSTRAVGEEQLARMGAPVPVGLSNGEFKLPPEQVHAIGVQALDGLKDATHTPVRGFAPAGQERGAEEPRMFFADGGVVDDERRRPISPSNIYPQGSPSAGRSPYASAGPAGAPTPDPGTAAQAQAQAAAPRIPGPSELFMQDRTQELRDQIGGGSYAQAAGTAARTAVQGLGMYGLEVADKVASPVVNAVRGFGEGLLGSANAAPAPATVPAAAPAIAPIAPAASPVGAEASRRSVTQGAQASAPAGAIVSAVETRPGVFEHGRGRFSDQASGMGFAPGFTGRPSAQNNAAAESLARATAPSAGLAEGTPAARGFAAPIARHSGNDWQARNDLRNAEVSASSITNTRRYGGRGAENNPAAVAYRTALATDQTLRQAQPGMDTETMRQNAALTREGMQQAGETQRAGTRAAIEAQRTGIAAQQADTQRRSVDSQVEAQGYANRVAAQQEQLRGVLTDPNATPQQKAQAQQSLRALAGQGQNDWRVQVTPAVKNADGSTSEGSVLRYNQATGQVERVDTSGGAAQFSNESLADPKTRPIGTVSTVNGKSATWDGAKWVPAA